MAERYSIVAHNVCRSLQLERLEKKGEFGPLTKLRNELIFRPSEDRAAYFFSFGVIVLFNFPQKDGAKLVKTVAAKYCDDRLAKPNAEEYEIIVDAERKTEVGFDSVVVNRLDPVHLQVIAEVLAQSAAIDDVEDRVGAIMERLKGAYSGLERDGRIRARDREVKKTIGAGIALVQYVVGQLALLDKPDIAWEDREAEALFLGMRKMFELEDRFRALEFRLDFIRDTSERILDILTDRRLIILEAAIVVLFVVDIVLVLYEVFVK